MIDDGWMDRCGCGCSGVVVCRCVVCRCVVCMCPTLPPFHPFRPSEQIWWGWRFGLDPGEKSREKMDRTWDMASLLDADGDAMQENARSRVKSVSV